MSQVSVKYNPYRLETTVKINGNSIESNSALYKLVKGKRLQEWIGKFPKELVNETNSVDFDIEFYGMPLDWDDFEYAFNEAKEGGVISGLSMKFVEGRSDDDINDKIVQFFWDLQDGPVEDFKDAKLIRAFENVNNSIFPINVIATMSSGKSTLINSMLQNKLMPSKNEACTATITEILDNDSENFIAVVYDEEGNKLYDIGELTYEVMNKLNDDEQVSRIAAEGDIPFLDSNSTALMLVDTPGPNNSRNQAHKNTTYRAINADSNNLILYVLNGTQLSTNDDASLLKYVADQIKKGGKQAHDRFLFVINKMDSFNPEEEDIGHVIETVKSYLSGYGIDEPQIFPCSAYTALNIRTYLKGIDIDNMTRAEERALPSAAKDTLPMIDKFIDHENMHLEQYSTLSPSAQKELNYQLKKAEEAHDTKELALIHCGIYSIEAAITAYVKKYAKTKKVKDLVESFSDVLESNQVLANAKMKVSMDEEAANACAARARFISEKIASGEEAADFKKKVADLNPISRIEEKAVSLKNEAAMSSSRLFDSYGAVIRDKDTARSLVKQFSLFSSDKVAEMTSELESVINREIIETGERLLLDYQQKLTTIDEESESKTLDFNTVDLIKGALSGMRELVAANATDDFAAETVDDMGEVEYEERSYYEKVGEEAEKVVVGSHEEKVGTRKVKVGSHKEVVGTRTVEKRNPNKKWWTFWRSNYIEVEEDVYADVDDYEDQDVYKTILDYKTVMRDVYEQRTETIENFKVETKTLQTGLVSTFRKSMDEGIDSAVRYADDQIKSMKSQFVRMFDELDRIISEKYDELNKCASDQKMKEEELERNKKILNWIEACTKEIDEILEI